MCWKVTWRGREVRSFRQDGQPERGKYDSSSTGIVHILLPLLGTFSLQSQYHPVLKCGFYYYSGMVKATDQEDSCH